MSFVALFVALAPGLVSAPPARTPMFSTSPLWLYGEVVIAPLVRDTARATELQIAVGGHIELLIGPDEIERPGIGLRAGPFGTFTVNLGEGTGLQAAAGLSVLVWSKTGNDTFAGAVLISGGVLGDFPAVDADALGGLARVSMGLTTTGDSLWKGISAWLFVEGHYIPDDGPGGERIEVMLGIRTGPLTTILLFVPHGADPSRER